MEKYIEGMNDIYCRFMGIKDVNEMRRYNKYMDNKFDSLDEYIGFYWGYLEHDANDEEEYIGQFDREFLYALHTEKTYDKELTKDDMYTMISRAYLAGFITDPYEIEQEINTWEDEEE